MPAAGGDAPGGRSAQLSAPGAGGAAKHQHRSRAALLLSEADWDPSWGPRPVAMTISRGADFDHPSSLYDRPPGPNYVRTPGGGWAPLAGPATPGFHKKMKNQFVVNGRAFPAKVTTFPNNMTHANETCAVQ
eukprot:TRINITY_DN62136_c0_g1_i1.p2 TRINITY_DN62136_c0_g1~~TRINITY_DN62136_c0_g1_i1.p2  ORF type:complete len:132 (+),score=22.28 TRINITY_DN62136_c0_g1_i1:144-539(+)